MSLDVDLMVTKPVSVYSANITHNLGTMASAVIVGENNLSLYDVLWRPDENGFEYAHNIIDYLYEGWKQLISDPNKYKQYNPANGWGSYEGLVDFVKRYHSACMENLDARLSVCR